MAVVKNAGATTLTTTPTAIAFDSESIDTSSYHDNVTNNSRLTVPATDNCELVFNTELVSTTSGDYQAVFSIKKNGTIFLTRQSSPFESGTGAAYVPVEISQIVAATAADYFEVFVSKSSVTPTMLLNG